MSPATEDAVRPIYVELEVSHPDLPLADLMETLPATTLEFEFQPATAALTGGFLTVVGTDSKTVRAALDDDPTVGEVLLLGLIDSQLVYRITVGDCVPLLPPDATDRGIRVLHAGTENGAWRLRLHCPDRSVLEALRRHYHDNGVSFRIKRLHDARTTRGAPSVTLSPVHRETLTIAYEAGYFDVPRNATQSELAERLGLSRSGVSQRLRRATAALVEQLLLQ
ncbi:helix-turn-helix domain-containing protein [Salinirubrum litoreum]|uniref:Helix-turn-helix domain-containing protein n=1 Tax=Salinirubrum litoreum TaxID=1126234 RepID=A0ABD5RCP3_9EURY